MGDTVDAGGLLTETTTRNSMATLQIRREHNCLVTALAEAIPASLLVLGIGGPGNNSEPTKYLSSEIDSFHGTPLFVSGVCREGKRGNPVQKQSVRPARPSHFVNIS